MVGKHKAGAKPRQKVLRNGRNAPRVPPFVMILNSVYDRLTKEKIRPGARVVLFELIRRHNGANNGVIGFSVRSGAKLRLSQGATQRALQELIDAGFIVRRAKGHFDYKTGAQQGRASEYGLAWLEMLPQTPTDVEDVAGPKIINGTNLRGNWSTRDAVAA